MLTFLRKIRKSLIISGSAKKYFLYAIGEIFLVMVGILLALQVNNWNENSKDRNKEKIILENLKKEHESNLIQIEEKILGCQERIKTDSFLLSLGAFDNKIVEDEKIEMMFASLTSPITFDPGNGVIKDLTNSGNINLITNEILKFKIAEWESNLAEVKEAEKFLMDLSIMPLNLYMVEYTAIRNAYKDFVGKSRFDHDPEILNDRKLENLIVGSLLNLNLLESRYLMIKEEMEEMIIIINKE